MTTASFTKPQIRYIPPRRAWDGHRLHGVWIRRIPLSSTVFEETKHTPTFLEQLLWFLYL